MDQLLKFLGLGLLAGLLTWCNGDASAKSLALGEGARLTASRAVSQTVYQPDAPRTPFSAPSERDAEEPRRKFHKFHPKRKEQKTGRAVRSHSSTHAR